MRLIFVLLLAVLQLVWLADACVHVRGADSSAVNMDDDPEPDALRMVDSQLEDNRRDQLYFSASTALPNKEKNETVLILARKALRYLIDNMPKSDLEVITADFLATITVNRIKKRLKRWPEVPWDVFVEFTLPYAALSEPRDKSLSKDFQNKLESHVDKYVTKDATLSQAAVVLNTKAYAITNPPIIFQAAAPNKVNAYSPYQVVQNKSSSCTGESVFLVYALRLAGIPARVAGVPHWNRGPQLCPLKDKSPKCGNHNWVEVFTEKGEWAFLDQNTANPLNKAWFVPELTNELKEGDRMHTIYAATWNIKTKLRFPLVFDPTYKEVSAVERTEWYQSNFHLPRTIAGDENFVAVAA